MGNNGGMSAAQAKRQQRIKREPLIAKPARYTIVDGNTTHTEVPLKKVIELCPGVTLSTLKRRLDAGERDVKQLRRAPIPTTNRRRHNPKPITR